MTKRQKKNLYRILIAAALMAILHFVPLEGAAKGVLYLIPYLVVGGDILKKAGQGVGAGQLVD